jgi:hypothetical protein
MVPWGLLPCSQQPRHFTLSGIAQFGLNPLFLVIENSLQYSHPILSYVSFTVTKFLVFINDSCNGYLSFMDLVNKYFKIILIKFLSSRTEIWSNYKWK